MAASAVSVYLSKAGEDFLTRITLPAPVDAAAASDAIGIVHRPACARIAAARACLSPCIVLGSLTTPIPVSERRVRFVWRPRAPRPRRGHSRARTPFAELAPNPQ